MTLWSIMWCWKISIMNHITKRTFTKFLMCASCMLKREHYQKKQKCLWNVEIAHNSQQNKCCKKSPQHHDHDPCARAQSRNTNSFAGQHVSFDTAHPQDRNSPSRTNGDFPTKKWRCTKRTPWHTNNTDGLVVTKLKWTISTLDTITQQNSHHRNQKKKALPRHYTPTKLRKLIDAHAFHKQHVTSDTGNRHHEWVCITPHSDNLRSTTCRGRIQLSTKPPNTLSLRRWCLLRTNWQESTFSRTRSTDLPHNLNPSAIEIATQFAMSQWTENTTTQHCTTMTHVCIALAVRTQVRSQNTLNILIITTIHHVCAPQNTNNGLVAKQQKMIWRTVNPITLQRDIKQRNENAATRSGSLCRTTCHLWHWTFVITETSQKHAKLQILQKMCCWNEIVNKINKNIPYSSMLARMRTTRNQKQHHTTWVQWQNLYPSRTHQWICNRQIATITPQILETERTATTPHNTTPPHHTTATDAPQMCPSSVFQRTRFLHRFIRRTTMSPPTQDMLINGTVRVYPKRQRDMRLMGKMVSAYPKLSDNTLPNNEFENLECQSNHATCFNVILDVAWRRP